MCRCNPSVRTPFCGKPGCEVPPQWKAKPPRGRGRGRLLDREAVLALIACETVPLTGFHIADRAAFAAYNLGRFQQALIQAVEGMAGEG